MYNNRDVSAGPVTEPLSLDEVKVFLKIDQDSEDDLLEALIVAAREHVEDCISKKLLTQTITRFADRLDNADSIKLVEPLQAVESVTSYDDTDAATVIAASNYLVDTAKGRLVWRNGYQPSQPQRAANGLVIEYTAGYGDSGADVPKPIIQALKALIAYLYEHREQHEEMPCSVKMLLQPYRVIRV